MAYGTSKEPLCSCYKPPAICSHSSFYLPLLLSCRRRKTGHGFACDFLFFIDSRHVHRERGAVPTDAYNLARLSTIDTGIRVQQLR